MISWDKSLWGEGQIGQQRGGMRTVWSPTRRANVCRVEDRARGGAAAGETVVVPRRCCTAARGSGSGASGGRSGRGRRAGGRAERRGRASRQGPRRGASPAVGVLRVQKFVRFARFDPVLAARCSQPEIQNHPKNMHSQNSKSLGGSSSRKTVTAATSGGSARPPATPGCSGSQR